MAMDMSMLGGMMSGFTRIQEEAASARVEGSAGGGLVVATCNGKLELTGIKITEAALEDRELLEDLVTAAVSDAQRKAQEQMAEQMKQLTGGLPLPPGLF